VFVIDEYETLFGRLRSALRANPDLRYTVVQPLLNQMVAFTRDHLLVFMGQQPDAHYILMDQNQLSAYVEQDPFPLFVHERGAATGEFAELVSKVLSERIAVDGGFLDSLHAESAGHPFLTVNLLVEFVDWLIDSRRPARALRLRAHDVEEFIAARLTSQRLKLSSEFDFFRAAIGEALSPHGATMNRWLHLIYRAVREIVLQSPASWSVTRDDFTTLAMNVLKVDDAGFTPEDLLRTGAQANFLAFDDTGVRPKIRMLGRLARETRPRIS
jgi:hypothetical protein